MPMILQVSRSMESSVIVDVVTVGMWLTAFLCPMVTAYFQAEFFSINIHLRSLAFQTQLMCHCVRPKPDVVVTVTRGQGQKATTPAQTSQ